MAHGKGSRKRARDKRLNAKRAMRASRQALWESLRGTSRNKKKKTNQVSGQASVFASVLAMVRVKINGVWQTAERMVHGGPNCGNIGCKRCSPIWRVA